MATKRLFVASRTTPAVTEAVLAYTQALRQRGWQGSFVGEQAIHLTYLFLGLVDDAQVADVAEQLSEITMPGFLLTLDRVGYFGPLREPTVIWVAPGSPPPELAALADAIRGSAGVWARQTPKPFRPHVTLLRPKRLAPREMFWPQWLPVDWTIDHFELIESVLTRFGAQYRTIRRYPCRTH
jgi:2'-5' RNA ligase